MCKLFIPPTLSLSLYIYIYIYTHSHELNIHLYQTKVERTNLPQRTPNIKQDFTWMYGLSIMCRAQMQLSIIPTTVI
uniref:Uncharacterized protein n=1 Tax=Arundo donax TaxID=35708 RepID=A0A0A9B060_ARUDO